MKIERVKAFCMAAAVQPTEMSPYEIYRGLYLYDIGQKLSVDVSRNFVVFWLQPVYFLSQPQTSSRAA